MENDDENTPTPAALNWWQWMSRRRQDEEDEEESGLLQPPTQGFTHIRPGDTLEVDDIGEG
jgi:hypothetical protein